MNGLLSTIRMLAQVSLVLSQFTRLTDGRIDRRTDRRTDISLMAKTALQRGKKMKQMWLFLNLPYATVCSRSLNSNLLDSFFTFYWGGVLPAKTPRL